MPGHVKRGGTGEPDPDPTPYLFVTYEEKQKDLAKPYDPKKSCWFPRKEGGFGEGIIEATEGDKVVVKAGGDWFKSQPCGYFHKHVVTFTTRESS